MLRLRFDRRIVRQLRETRGWTREQVARKARIRYRTLLFIEKGHTEPRAKTLAGLAHAFGVSIDSLFAAPHQKANGGEAA